MLVGFIGGGNMATALISGLKGRGRKDLTVRVCDPDGAARHRLRSTYGVDVFAEPAAVVRDADVIVIAVKPQAIPEVLQALSHIASPSQLVLSVAAGIPIAAFEASLSPSQAVIRAMPNTPALIGKGITGVCANPNCRPHHRQQAEQILGAAGQVVWIPEEELMDAVTAVSGSGPAYFFLLAEALAEAGEQLGLPPDIARQLARQTCVGAGAMLGTSPDEVAVLRRRVTSPGGTTQSALDAFEIGGFKELVRIAVSAAERRGRELSGSAD